MASAHETYPVAAVGPLIEVRAEGGVVERRLVEGRLEVGRECDGLVIDDPRISRRHLVLSWDGGSLTAADAGSRNGTFLNGRRIAGPTVLQPGDTIRIGRTDIEVVVPPVEPAATPRPLLDELALLSTEAAEIRFRPGTAGERASKAVAGSCRRARRRLAGLGSEPWGLRPQLCLVDPFPDPGHEGQLVTRGTIVDADRGEIWMVVTAESPAEAPERPMALFFGSRLPAGRELERLLEGYGLLAGESPNPDHRLREMSLPPITEADDELASAMALSFVRFLVEREGRDRFLRLLASAQPGKVDGTAHELYGAGLAALEEAWREGLRARRPGVGTMRFLRLAAGYLRPHVRREAEIGVYMLVGLAFTILFPFVTRRLFDQALPSGRISDVLTLLAAVAAALAVSLLAGLRRSYLSAYVSGAVTREIRARMFARLQALSPGWFTRHQQGDVLSRMFSDVAILESGLSQTLREGLFQALTLAVASIVLLLLSPILGAVVLVGAPLVAIVYRAMSRGAQERSIAVQERSGGLFSVSAENYQAQPVVKAFALEARERGRFARGAERLFQAERRLALYGGLFNLSVTSIVMLLRLVVLGLGAWLILRGRLTIGGLVAFMGLMGEVLGPVTALTGLGQQVQASSGALIRINQVVEEVPDLADQPAAAALPPLSRDIRLEHVSFSYTSDRLVLEDIDGTIEAGSRVAFVGPTGAGKSSVLQLLMRLADPDSGAVLFDGHDIRQARLPSLRSQLGVVFQDTFLFDTTVRENIALGKPGATDAEVEAAARAAELHDFISELPRGYDTLIGERGSRLSGGQRQRLCIARALVRDPAVLLLDEATSALDPRTERLITETLSRAGRGRTTIAVTHRLNSIADYDRMFVIVAGRLVEQGGHEELLRRGGVYAELWAEQAGEVRANAAFDAAGALALVPLFQALSGSELAAVVRRLRPVEVAPGERPAEGGGGLSLMRRGRARVLVPGFGGDLAVVAELGPGDVFGLSALLGEETGSVLEAVEAVSLLVLDGPAFADLVGQVPTLAAGFEGTRRSRVLPRGGRRLSRLTMPRPQAELRS
jgi:ABC-type multidrug transport system fused ATPase/permease subunit